jgi:hypothetical protein
MSIGQGLTEARANVTECASARVPSLPSVTECEIPESAGGFEERPEHCQESGFGTPIGEAHGGTLAANQGQRPA